MATYKTAIEWMKAKSTNEAEFNGHLYRIRNGQLEEGSYKGDCVWEPVEKEEISDESHGWDLQEAF